MTAFDGAYIYLDNDFSNKGKAGFSGALNVCWIALVMCILAPLFVIVWQGFSSDYLLSLRIPWWVFYVEVILCISCVVFMRIHFFRTRHPMTYHWGQMLFCSFRIYYMGALLWLSLTGISVWVYFLVIALWGGAELKNYYEVRRVSDEEIICAFRKRFKKHPNGYWLYDPLVNIKNVHRRNRKVGEKWRGRIEALGAGVLVIIGPALIIRSQLYRDNFEPRYMIVAGVLLISAIAAHRMTTEFDIVRRAMKLKRKGSF
ncbi:hypothetical protein ACUY1T_02550 [Billgrantia sp. Q4P2]|uniref:hypothetical protein n=1 Tax=Billgrantia sp. Q4P2 TaxID=3463857 RepID=UPI004056A416